MAKLKAFVTHSGFFELAVAAPSMKAAAEALGLGANAFNHGLAKQTEEAAIVAAVSAEPGTVLRRAAGSKDKFARDAALPKLKSIKLSAIKKSISEKSPGLSRMKKRASARRAEREQANAKRTEKIRQKYAAAFDKAEKRHEAIIRQIAQDRERLARRAEEEDGRWMKEKLRLKDRQA